jgi:hypothetical protein
VESPRLRQAAWRGKAAGDSLREVFALDQLHDEPVYGIRFLEPVDRGDVRVIQGCERLRLPFEAHDAIGIGGKRVRQDLDRHLPAEGGVDGAPHLSHAAGADRCGDLVHAETRARGQGHVCWWITGAEPHPSPAERHATLRLADDIPGSLEVQTAQTSPNTCTRPYCRK